MKKAFLFTVIFVLLFTVFLLLSVFYLRMLQMSELNLAQTENTTRVIYVLDDVKSDFLDFLKLSLTIESNSTHTILNISDVLPSPFTNPNTTLGEYKSFINGTYSNQTNLLNPATNLSVISLNTTSFQSSPSLQFINSNSSLNLYYKYNNLSKNELVINGSNLTREYSVSIKLNKTCLNENCENATFAGGPPHNDSSTRGLWHFDEGSGTTVSDSSGNGNDGVLSSAGIDWVGGRFLYGLRFNSSTGAEHITIEDSNTLDINGEFTIELWFMPYGTGLSEWLLNKGNTSNYNDSNYQIWIDDTPNKIRVSIGNGTTDQNLTSSNPIQTNTWYHLAFSGDGTTLKLYINGVLDNYTSQTLTPSPNNGALVIAGRTTSDVLFRFNGTIDEVAVYSRAKSAEEIAADASLFHWDWGPIGINNNISAAWHFDEGSGNVSYDSSGNGNAASLSGSIIQITTEIPGGYNKAYVASSTTQNTPFNATTEFTSAQYGYINTSDSVYMSSTAQETITQSCNSPELGGCEENPPSYECDIDGCSPVTCTAPASWCNDLANSVWTSTCAKTNAYCYCRYNRYGDFYYCLPSGCSKTGSCTYTCNSGYYDADGTDSNGCESTTPSYIYTFQRYTFNLSSYNWGDINELKFCWKGKFNTTGRENSSTLLWYNTQTSSWVSWQTLPYNSENTYCAVFDTTNKSLVYNSTDGLVQFAVSGMQAKTGHVLTDYADYAYLNMTLSLVGTGADIAWVPGRFGGALQFNSSGWVRAIDSNSLDITNQLTIEAWVKPDTVNPATTWQTILHKGNNTVENYYFGLKNDELYFMWTNSGQYAAETTGAHIQPNIWSHVAVVFNYSGNAVRFYLNGVEVGSGATAADLQPNDYPLAIAGGEGAWGFNGTIDEVAVYSRAKSAEEIAADANPLYISLDIKDELNSTVSIRGATSGYINPGANNTLYLKTNGGSLNVTAGAYFGLYSLRIYSNNTRANLLIKTIQEGVSSIKAVLPVQVQVYQQLFSNLIVAEK